VPCGDASEELPPRFFQSLEARAETSMYDMISEDFIATCAWAFRAGEAMRRPPAVKLLQICFSSCSSGHLPFRLRYEVTLRVLYLVMPKHVSKDTWLLPGVRWFLVPDRGYEAGCLLIAGLK